MYAERPAAGSALDSASQNVASQPAMSVGSGVGRGIRAIEAARMDGAGYVTVIVRVAVPLLLPGIISTEIVCLILAYNEFLFASVLTRSESA